MKNRGWIVVVGMFVLVLAACGSGATEGGNDPSDDIVIDDIGPSDDTAPLCGNGMCETGEGCSSCENDCACNAEYTACRNDACVDWDSINPLLKKMEGYWVRTDGETADVTMEPGNPACGPVGQNLGEPGDACVRGFSPSGAIILKGTRLYGSNPTTYTVEGSVLNDGMRVEFDFSSPYMDSMHLVYDKQ